MFFTSLIAAAALPLAAFAAPIQQADQAPLTKVVHPPTLPVDVWSASVKHEKVAGVNEAYYCHVPRSKQLFWLHNLDVIPSHAELNGNYFLSLKGWVPDAEALKAAPVTVDVTKDKTNDPLTISGRLADFARITVRRATKARESAQARVVELVADSLPPSRMISSGRHSVRVHAKVPDGRTLFCIESMVELGEVKS